MNVIELFAKFVMDTSDLDKGLKGAESKLSSFSGVVGSGLAGAAKLGAAALATTATAAIGAATAVAAVAKQSASAYAEYQQLQGGIQTLFNDGGKAAAEYRAELEATGATEAEIARAMANFEDPTATVMKNAANAYKTAGMSANQYMDTVINMAASLNKATGDMEESTKLADMAITDMSDNVNKMGTSMEMVQNAYRGFTRGNFSMLDNLALGYAGTKAGMEELLADAEKISGIKYDISSYADIVQAIHVVQTEMGITGTTAAEAADTISGSAGALSAAWDNLILGLADKNADLGELISNVVESAKTAFTNILPAFTQAIRGIGDLVGQIAPVIAEELPGIIDQVLPPLLDAASSLITSVIDAIPGLLGVLEQNSEMLINSLLDIISTILNGIYTFVVEDLDSLLSTIMESVVAPLLGELPHLLAVLINIAGQIISSLADQLPGLMVTLVQTIVDLLGTLLAEDNISYIIGLATEIISALADGIVGAIPILVNAIPDILTGIINGLVDGIGILLDVVPDIYKAIEQALIDNSDELLEGLLGLWETIARNIPELLSNAIGFVSEMVTTIIDLFHQIWDKKGPEIMETLRKFMTEEVPKISKELSKQVPVLFEAIMDIISQLLTAFPEILTTMISFLPDIIKLFVDAFVLLLPIMIEELTSVILILAEQLPEIITPLALMMPELLTALASVIIECLPILLDAIIRIVAAIVVALPDVCQAIVLAMPGIIDSIMMALANIIVGIEDLLIKIRDKILETLNKLADLVIEALDFWQPIYDNAMTWLADLIVGFEDWIAGIWEDITGFYDDLMLEFAGWIIDVGDKFTEMVDKIKEIITGLIDEALTWGGDLVDNFVKGITDSDSLEDAVGEEGMAGTVRKFLHFSKPDEGPLADFDTYAPDMMELFAKGITDNTRVVGDAVRGAFDFGGMITGGMPTGGAQMPGLITPTASQPVQVTLVLDKQQLGKVVFDLNNQERQRVGVTLGKEAFA